MEKLREKIKLAFIEQTAELGGAQLNNYDFHKGFDRAQFDSIVICPQAGPLTMKLRALDIRTVLLPMVPLISTSIRIKKFYLLNPFAIIFNFFAFIPLVFQLVRILRKENVHVVVTSGLLSHFYGGAAAFLTSIPCVWLLQDIFNRNIGFGLGPLFFQGMVHWLPKKVVCISKAVQNAMAPSLPNDKITVIYNGVDPEEYSPIKPFKRILREEFDIPNSAVVVGIFSRLIYWKGHLEFIKAANKVIQKTNQARFVIVGAPLFEASSYEKELKDLVQNLGLAAYVFFAGFRGDVPECLASVDISCLPSVSPEPFGRTIIEAMAMEKPVIATGLGGVPEIVVHENTGIIVPAKDINALANAMVDLITDLDKRIQMGKNGRKRVLDLFQQKTFVEKHCNLFLEIGHKRRSACYARMKADF